MALVVLRAGLHTTVQDHGRPGHRSVGVPPGGAFDRSSHDLANALVGNAPESDSATLEMTLVGGVFLARKPLAIALAGAPMRCRVESLDRVEEIAVPGCVTLPEGTRLVVEGTPRGVRTYLAVAGGFQTPLILGSRSREQPLREGDVIETFASRIPSRRPKNVGDAFLDHDEIDLRAVDGPDLDGFETGPRPWPGDVYRVGVRSDRLGLRLEGPPVVLASDPDRLSAPLAPGAVQIAGGQPLVLGVACGTMGGYPHVAHVLTVDLPRLAQARPGGTIRFERIEIADAWRIDRDESAARQQELRALATMARDGLQFDPAD